MIKGLINDALVTILSIGHWLCVFLGMGSLVVYLCGFKKGSKFVTLSLILDFLLQCLKMVI